MTRLRLVQNNIAYAVGSAANSLALFLLIPFLVNALSVEEYGLWVLFEIAIVLLTTLLTAGLDIGLMRDYWFLEGEAQRRRLMGSVLLAVCAWGGAVSLLGGAMVLWPGGAVAPAERAALLLALAVSFVETLFMLLLTLLRIREQATHFVALSAGRMVLFLMLALAGVALLGGVEGALAGRLVAALVGLAAAFAITRHSITPSLEWARLRRVITYGLPLLPANLAAYLLYASDRYVMQAVSTLAMVGVYSFAYKVATTVDVMITRPFSLDWAPRRFKIASEPDAERRYSQILNLYLFASLGATLLIYASTAPIYAVLAPPEYAAGRGLVPLILVAYLILGLGYPLNVGIMLRDKTKYLPLISWLAAGICLLLNLLWIPRFGMVGAVWATIVAYSVQTTGLASLSLRLYPIRYSLGALAALVGTAGVGAMGIWWVDRVVDGVALWPAWGAKMLWVSLLWGALAVTLWRDRLWSLRGLRWLQAAGGNR